MKDKELDEAARRLYDSSDNRVKPSWDQLGEGTKGVWKDRILARERDFKAGWDAYKKANIHQDNPREMYGVELAKLLRRGA